MATDRRRAEIDRTTPRHRRPLAPPLQRSRGVPVSVDSPGRWLSPRAVLNVQRLVGNKTTAAILRATSVKAEREFDLGAPDFKRSRESLQRVGPAAGERGSSTERCPVPIRREALPLRRSAVDGLDPVARSSGNHAPDDQTVQRMVGINSSDITQEITGLVGKGWLGNTAPWTEAYTLLQHIDWAHNIVNGETFDMGQPVFNKLGVGENLILVAHGAQGTSGKFSGTQIADLLADQQSGVPQNWTGSVFITSCYSGVGPASVAEDAAKRLGVLARPGISVTGYQGSTYTHKRFDNALFVLDEKKKAQIDLLSSAAEKKYAHLFAPWVAKMGNLNVGNLADMASYTAELTDAIYKEIIEQAAAKGLFLDESDAEATFVSQ